MPNPMLKSDRFGMEKLPLLSVEQSHLTVKIRPFRYGKDLKTIRKTVPNKPEVKIRPFRYGKEAKCPNIEKFINSLKSDRFGMENLWL